MTVCFVVVWHFWNESSIQTHFMTLISLAESLLLTEALCSGNDISLSAQTALAFTGCHVKLDELMEILRWKFSELNANASSPIRELAHVSICDLPCLSVILWPTHTHTHKDRLLSTVVLGTGFEGVCVHTDVHEGRLQYVEDNVTGHWGLVFYHFEGFYFRIMSRWLHFILLIAWPTKVNK